MRPIVTKRTPDPRYPFVAYYEGDEEAGARGWGRTDVDARRDLVEEFPDDGAVEHPDVRVVPCETCGTEGRLYERVTTYERNAAPHDDLVDTGPCPDCEGTGGELVKVEPVEPCPRCGGDESQCNYDFATESCSEMELVELRNLGVKFEE